MTFLTKLALIIGHLTNRMINSKKIVEGILLGSLAAMPACELLKSTAPPKEVEQIDRETARIRNLCVYALNPKPDKLTDTRELMKECEKSLEVLKDIDPYKKEKIYLRLFGHLDANKMLALEEFKSLVQRILNNNKIVGNDGTVNFTTEKEERTLSLGDLTPEDRFRFAVRNNSTIEEMNMSGPGIIRVKRATEDKKVLSGRFNGRKTVEKGGIVTEGEVGEQRRVYVFNGDRILPEKFNKEIKEPAHPLFEKFIYTLDPEYSLDKARYHFHKYFSGFHYILINEFLELNLKSEILSEQLFAWYLLWCDRDRLPVNESGMRLFFSEIMHNENPGKDSIVHDIRKTLEKGENGLDQKNAPADMEFETAERIKKEYGVMAAYIYLQGKKFDQYFYNRVTGNHIAKLSAISGHEGTKVKVDNLVHHRGSMPDFLRTKYLSIKRPSFANMILMTTVYKTERDDWPLKLDVMDSMRVFEGKNLKSGDVKIIHDRSADKPKPIISIWAINDNPETNEDHPYRPLKYTFRFLTTFDKIDYTDEKGSEIRFFEIDVNGEKIKIGTEDYFTNYQALLKANKNRPRFKYLYDRENGEIHIKIDPNWYVEYGNAFYKGLAEKITANAATKSEKTEKLREWIDANIQNSGDKTVNIALGTLMQGLGSDISREILFKTLALNLGIENPAEIDAEDPQNRFEEINQGQAGLENICEFNYQSQKIREYLEDFPNLPELKKLSLNGTGHLKLMLFQTENLVKEMVLNGEMENSDYLKWHRLKQNADTFLKKAETFVEEEVKKVRRIKLSDIKGKFPRVYREMLDKYESADNLFCSRVNKTVRQIDFLMQKARDSKNNPDELKAFYGEMVKLADDSGLIEAEELMQEIESEILMELPEEFRPGMKFQKRITEESLRRSVIINEKIFFPICEVEMMIKED